MCLERAAPTQGHQATTQDQVVPTTTSIIQVVWKTQVKVGTLWETHLGNVTQPTWTVFTTWTQPNYSGTSLGTCSSTQLYEWASCDAARTTSTT